ncbi:MAG TPA: hypothetical protein DCQ94_19640 [Nitrospira sp.]|nr:hypothetical protein [Nitrospira sp.]HRI80992.1 LacI family DNA-binding transcriptional regulator [Opitutaceae bacterium]HRJ47854.1 LacI family DNA-binding transcriptional regulator [Opitutaceae bacterium]
MPSRLNLRLIAQKAGVSATTVSYALRNDPRVRAETRKMIEEIALSLGYRMNPLVAALMTRIKSGRPINYQGTIAVLHDHLLEQRDDERPTAERFMAGALAGAGRHGFKADKFELNEVQKHPETFKRVLRARGIRGLVVLPPVTTKLELAIDLEDIAPVCIGYPVVSPELHRVAHHHHKSFSLVWRELAERRLRRIALVVDELVDDRVSNHWLASYFFHSHHQSVRERIPPFEHHSGLDSDTISRFAQWRSRYRPDVVVVAGTARIVLGWLQSLDLKVPNDLGVVALRAQSPDVTGIDQREEEVAAAAAAAVITNLLNNDFGIPSYPHLTLVPGRWVEGKTLKPGWTEHIRRCKLA